MMHCRICQSKATAINDFGQMPIANGFVFNIDDDKYRFSMETSFCNECSLFQLDNQPKPELMFHNGYPFFTGLSKSMQVHFGEMVESSLIESKEKFAEIFVVEVGSNDGTLLEFVKNKGIRHLGIDPSENVVQSSWKKGISAEVGFYSESLAKDIVRRHGKADFIFAANVICHIPDLLDFGKGIKELLSIEGQFIFEEPYIGSMINKTSYDQIYDEHVYIFGALSVKNVFNKIGLELVDAIPQLTHGGSMRYILKHTGVSEVSNRALEILKNELEENLNDVSTYLSFAARCQQRRIEFKELLKKLKSEGAKIAGYAATSKSTTVLNYCGIGNDLISYISDSTPEKQNRFTPGSHIPIISHEEMKMNPPDYLVLFAWNHEKEVLKKEKELTSQGVKWIRFVPKVEILDIK